MGWVASLSSNGCRTESVGTFVYRSLLLGFVLSGTLCLIFLVLFLSACFPFDWQFHECNIEPAHDSEFFKFIISSSHWLLSKSHALLMLYEIY